MIGSAIKYFEGGFTEEYIKWQMPWNEFMLYMASIPSYSDGNDKPTSDTKPMEIENWC